MLFSVFLPGKSLVTLQLGPLEMTYFLQKKGHYVYSKRSPECSSTFRGMLSYTAIGNLPEPRLHSSAERQQVSSLEGTPWREAWLLTFGMGDEVVSEWGVGAGVMERGAAGARGCHAPRAQSQQLCGHGEAGAGQNGDKEKQ